MAGTPRTHTRDDVARRGSPSASDAAAAGTRRKTHAVSRASFSTAGANGAGVVELIDELIRTDLAGRRGPHGRLRLRAQNLVTFCDLAAGVDDDTWLFHLRGRHYSEWLRSAVKDEDLAREVAAIERADELTPEQSRRIVRDAIDRRYTLPA